MKKKKTVEQSFEGLTNQAGDKISDSSWIRIV